MGKGRLRRPSPALVIAIVALVVASAGTGYAAIKLPRSSVGTKQLRRGAVTTSKVRNRTLTRQDFRSGQLRRGPAGPPGATGQPGAPGEPGPSNAIEVHRVNFTVPTSAATVTTTVPPGDYVAHATVQLPARMGTDIDLNCTLAAAGTTDTARAFVGDAASASPTNGTGGQGYAALPVQIAFTAPASAAPTQVQLTCDVNTGSLTVSRASIVIVRTGALVSREVSG